MNTGSNDKVWGMVFCATYTAPPWTEGIFQNAHCVTPSSFSYITLLGSYWRESFNFGIAVVHLLLLCLLQIVSDHWLELWECTALALCQRWKPQSSAQDSEIGLGAHSLEALGPSCTHWPKPTQPSAASTRHSQLCSGPSSLWPPCTFTSCAFLAPAARCACVCCSPSPYPLISLDLLLLPFLISPRCLTSRFPICPLTVSAPSVWVVVFFLL